MINIIKYKKPNIFSAVVRANVCPPAESAQIQECVHPVAEYAKVLNNNQVTFIKFVYLFVVTFMRGDLLNVQTFQKAAMRVRITG